MRKLGANQTLFWLWIPEHALSSFFFFYSALMIYKQRPRRLSLCRTNWSSTLSTLIFSLWMCNIANDKRRSSVIVFLKFNQSGVFIIRSWLRTSEMLRIETITKHFKIFILKLVKTPPRATSKS